MLSGILPFWQYLSTQPLVMLLLLLCVRFVQPTLQAGRTANTKCAAVEQSRSGVIVLDAAAIFCLPVKIPSCPVAEGDERAVVVAVGCWLLLSQKSVTLVLCQRHYPLACSVGFCFRSPSIGGIIQEVAIQPHPMTHMQEEHTAVVPVYPKGYANVRPK